ncbi:Protein of unknown function [Cotesia congregata]|uniref:Uncharacterized protein n=1 Tax=Cotesia congregata TaxID=51543 RepID=A0A8J2E4K1_COTCN|nr:Protein of unknown function [Cotesia congregata]
MLDTWSEVNLIKIGALRKLALSRINNKPVYTLGKAYVELFGYEVEFNEVNDKFPTVHPALLGAKFFNEYGARVFFDYKIFTFYDVEVPFFETETEALPPNSVSSITIETSDSYEHGYIPRIYCATDVELGGTFETNENGHTFLRAYNSSDDEILIPKPVINLRPPLWFDESDYAIESKVIKITDDYYGKANLNSNKVTRDKTRRVEDTTSDVKKNPVTTNNNPGRFEDLQSDAKGKFGGSKTVCLTLKGVYKAQIAVGEGKNEPNKNNNPIPKRSTLQRPNQKTLPPPSDNSSRETSADSQMENERNLRGRIARNTVSSGNAEEMTDERQLYTDGESSDDDRRSEGGGVGDDVGNVPPRAPRRHPAVTPQSREIAPNVRETRDRLSMQSDNILIFVNVKGEPCDEGSRELSGVLQIPNNLHDNYCRSTVINYRGNKHCIVAVPKYRNLDLKRIKQTETAAGANLRRSKEISKLYYDRKINPLGVRPGTRVFLLLEPRKGKGDPKYTGPHDLLGIGENEVAEILINGVSKFVHVNKLRISRI